MILFRFLRSRRGIGLVQVMVGGFVASIMALGIAQMMSNSRIAQRRISVVNTVAELQKRINTMILDQSAFNFTINGNTGQPFTNLKAGLAVTESSSATKIVLYDGSGMMASALDLLGAGETTGNGFTERGNPCTNFSAVPNGGNDDCPISFRVMITTDCPMGATCRDPQMTIAARAVFNPAPNKGLEKFKYLIPQAPADTTSPAAKYDVVIKRTSSSIERTFKVGSYASGSSGGGTCTTGATAAKHPLTTSAGWTLMYDANVLLNPLLNSPTNGDFQIQEIGYYTCSVTAYGYATGQYNVSLRNITAGLTLGEASTFASYASGNGMSLLRMDTSFYVSVANQVYNVFQKCENNAMGVYTTGFNVDYSNITPLVAVSCSKMDTAF